MLSRVLRWVKPLLTVACFMALAGCYATDPGLTPVPRDLIDQSGVEGYHNIRFYSSEAPDLRRLAAVGIHAAELAHPGQNLKGRRVDINYLSLSGGGEDGAFGAGLLNGWSAAGTRPKFDVVTGVSTGSLIAPFAFLGSDYDAILKEAYTTISTADIARVNVLFAAVGLAPSISSDALFEKLIARYMTKQVLNAIAQEYRKGRALFVGTTDLDAQRPVIWNIGAIADSGRPDALELARRIIMASASIPGVFPPVRMKVTVDGKVYDELHVDGGVTRQVFLFPPGYDPKLVDEAIGWKPRRRAFIIQDARVGPEYQAMNDALLPVAGRSISTLIKTQGVADLFRVALLCKRYNIDYNLAYIPDDFERVSKEMFDRAYMNSLYEFAYQKALHGYPWRKQPPGLETAVR